MPRYDFNSTLLGLINSAVSVTNLQPITFGGGQGPAGGVGGRPGGFLGKLPQWQITYDQTEEATDYTVGSGIAPSGLILPSGTIPSLVDNLNHIRKRIEDLEFAQPASGINIALNDELIGSGPTINFKEGSNISITVEDVGNIVDVELSVSGLQDGIYSITVESPTDDENINMGFTFVDITVQEVQAVIGGAGSPSITIDPYHTQNRSSAGNSILSSGVAITNTTTGQNLTSFNDPTIPADSWIILKTTASGVGPNDELTVSVRYIKG